MSDITNEEEAIEPTLGRSEQEFGSRQILADVGNHTPEDEPHCHSEAETTNLSQETLEIFDGPQQNLSLSSSKGKGKAVESNQDIPENIALGDRSNRDKGKGKNMESHIKFDIYDVPGQSAAEAILADLNVPHLGNELVHQGVGCDGPLCTNVKTYIKGQRYKCMHCDQIDFCSNCVASLYNDHNAQHAMVKCLLPTRFTTIRDIDDNTKKELVSSCGDVTLKEEDIMHVIYAESSRPASLSSEQLIETLRPACFPIFRSNAKPQIRWTETGPKPSTTQFVTQYRIDDGANVAVQHKPVGSAPSPVRDERVMHHQDAELIMKVLSGKILQFKYPSQGIFWQGAWAGRPVTRLIDLKPGDYEDKLECNIREVDLSEGPAYEALSYTWKETAYERANHSSWTKEVDKTFKSMTQYRHAIYCGDAFIQINVGLRDALRRLRDPVETKTYWVDQLSINQRNPSERAFQVQGMRHIYNRAKCVIVWAGDEDEDTTPAINIIRKLASARYASQGFALGIAPEELVADQVLDLPSLQSPNWKSLLNFFLRPVFGRMWVIQEVVLAQQIDVRCGNNMITWSELASTATFLAQYSWMNALSTYRDGQGELSLFTLEIEVVSNRNIAKLNTSANILMINGFRDDFHSLREVSIDRLLYGTTIFDASDPRDRIYSLLGIKSARSDPNTTNGIQVDYEKSIQSVYTDATKATIVETNSLDICGMNTSLSTKAITGLPSWVPDYTSNVTCSASALSRPDPLNPYSASGDSKSITIWPYEHQENILIASTFKVGTIAIVAHHTIPEDGLLGPLISEWTRLATQCGSDYITGEFTPDVFWRTCVADATPKWRQSPAPPSYHRQLAKMFFGHVIHHFTSDLALTDECQQKRPHLFQERIQSVANPILGTLANDAIAFEEKEDENNDDANGPSEGRMAFWATCTNRRFFITEDKHIGIGPIDAQAGDEIHILSGARVPFVLRRLDLDHTSVPDDYDHNVPPYTMIGETYVHGLMRGEALKTEGFEWNGVCIH